MPIWITNFQYSQYTKIKHIRVVLRSICEGQKMIALQNVGIIGVPFDKGQKKYGVGVTPAAMRSAGLIEELKQIDTINIQDYGDIEIADVQENVPMENMRNVAAVGACDRKLSNKVAEVLCDGRLVVTIGGDHSIAVGTVDGHLRVHDNLILIWVDAHADINTNKTSGSGSIHGMPIAIFTQEYINYWNPLPPFDWQKRIFSIKSLGYIGLRSVDPYERLAIKKFRIPAYAMENIDDIGITKVINNLLEQLDPERSRPIHVSFDIDALDPLEAPSTGTPVRGGLTLREGIEIMEVVHATGRLRAMDLVEINPAIGNEYDRMRTIDAGMSVLKAALGFDRKGSAPMGVDDLPPPDYST